MKTTLITLPILGFLSTPTVATFLVGVWTMYPKAVEGRKALAAGTFITTGTNQFNVLNAGLG
jgi:hypothetical protein